MRSRTARAARRATPRHVPRLERNDAAGSEDGLFGFGNPTSHARNRGAGDRRGMVSPQGSGSSFRTPIYICTPWGVSPGLWRIPGHGLETLGGLVLFAG